MGSDSSLILDENIEFSPSLMEKIVSGAFAYSGQVCISIQKLHLPRKRFEEFLNLLCGRIEKLVYGDPLKEETEISSLISIKEAERIQNWMEESIQKGANLHIGGKLKTNTIMEATVFSNLPNSCRIYCEEAFGPILIIETYDSLDEAIQKVNRSAYGLQCGFFSNNFSHILKVIKTIKVFGIHINDVPTFRVDHMPYGGIKNSGFGKEGIRYAIREMMQEKFISFKEY